MELVQADQFPCLVDRFARVSVIGELRSIGGKEFGVVHEYFALAIIAFVSALAGVRTPVIFKVKFTVPHGKLIGDLGFNTLHEFTHGAGPNAWRARVILKMLNVLQHLAGRAAAAVAISISGD